MATSGSPTLQKRLGAEFLGTFVLVFGGCGAAVLAANFPDPERNTLGIGFLGVALAFGLSVLVMAYAVGHVSGGHFNPAVTLGAAAAGRFPWRDTVAYIVSQVVAAIAAAALLYVIASARSEFSTEGPNAFATNGYAANSPGGYSLLAALVIEVVLTAIFLYVILGVTDTRASAGFAPLAIGMTLTLIHLISIPVTNTSVNPARSIGPALFVGGDALSQLWLFLVAPVAGALIAGFTYAFVLGTNSKRPAAGRQGAAQSTQTQ